MKEILKDGFRISAKAIVINILCFFTVISMVVLGSALFSEKVDYTATVIKDEEVVEQYTHYTEDGEDKKAAEYEGKEGYKVDKQDLKLIPEDKNKIILAVAQLFALGILAAFLYPKIWDKGYKDRNMAMTGNQKADPMKGLKSGLAAIIIPEVLIIALSFIKSFPSLLLKFVFPVFYSVIDLVAENGEKLCDLSLWRLAVIMALFLTVPLITGLSYYLGFKDFSIGEKFIYKTKKRR